MAANSKREQLLVAMVALGNGLTAINTVKRIQPTGLTELKAYTGPQLPLAVILGGMPIPNPKLSQQTRRMDKAISDLAVDFFIYALDNTTPDSTISTLADDLWVALWADVTQGFKWVIGTKVEPEPGTGIWPPYCGFNMRATITYKHGTGGI
jgi:hypothetical protein